MDFNDTPEQAAFRAEARAWLDEHAAAFHRPKAGGSTSAVATDEDVKRAKEWQALKAEAGWAAVHWPEQYGGRGLSRLHTIIYNQEESRYNLPSGFFHIGLNFCAPTLMEYASEEQKARYLPKLLRGEEIWCQLFSEPAAGSDLAGLRMRSERDGDEWVVNGQKIWTTYAHISDYGILVTRHDPSLAKHKGLTYFFVDMHAPGVEPRPIKQIAGTSNFNEVFFTNVRIPDAWRLGEVGEGWQVSLTTLLHERLGAGSADMPPNFEQALRLARSVDLENGPAIRDKGVRERLADWFVETRGLELVGWRILTAIAKGEQPGSEASIRKLVAASKTQDISSFGVDLQELGGILTDAGDVAQEGLFEEGFLHSPGARIAGGTDEILRNILAERVLGLPGEVRRDRDVPFRDIPTGRA